MLHRYDWSESSLILDVFTRHYGRVALVARGAKKPSSSFRPILLPMQPLHVAFGGDAEIRNLKSAEWQGGHVMPSGDALLSGYYLNELLMRLLARDDPHPLLFDAYAATVQLLASQNPDTLQLALRAFELRLLRDIGLLPLLHVETATLAAVLPQQHYVLVAEAGLRLAHADDRVSRYANKAVGSGGDVTFSFKAKARGTGDIALKHWRDWEGESSVVGRFRLHVKIA